VKWKNRKMITSTFGEWRCGHGPTELRQCGGLPPTRMASNSPRLSSSLATPTHVLGIL
jgi:hypothetical protein